MSEPQELFNLDELESLAWAVAHLIDKHGYDALSSRDGSRVKLKDLYEKTTRVAAALGLTAEQEGENDE